MKKTTTLRELISNIDFNNKSIQSNIDFEKLAEIFGIKGLYDSNDTRIKAYFIKKCLSTDSIVGLRAYFLDNKFIGISNQIGRKYPEDFTFVSEDAASTLRTYLCSLLERDDYYEIIDDNFLDCEIPNTFKVEYNTEIVNETAFLNEEKVKIIKTWYPYSDQERHFHTVEVEKIDGTKIEVDCRDLDFEYNT